MDVCGSSNFNPQCFPEVILLRLCCADNTDFNLAPSSVSRVSMKLDIFWLTSSQLDLSSSYFSFSPKPIPDVSVSSLNLITREAEIELQPITCSFEHTHTPGEYWFNVLCFGSCNSGPQCFPARAHHPH